MRAPASGRNWEGFGGDPFLSGEGAYETIMGVQSAGVQGQQGRYWLQFFLIFLTY